MHGEFAEKIVLVQHPRGIGNNVTRQERDDTRRHHRKYADNISRDLQILQFGSFDLSIYLRQRFKSAHGKKRMPERDDDGENPKLNHSASVEPAAAILSKHKI